MVVDAMCVYAQTHLKQRRHYHEEAKANKTAIPSRECAGVQLNAMLPIQALVQESTMTNCKGELMCLQQPHTKELCHTLGYCVIDR